MKNKKAKQMMEDVHGIVFGRSLYSVSHGINKKQIFFKFYSPWKYKKNLTASLTANQLKGIKWTTRKSWALT